MLPKINIISIRCFTVFIIILGGSNSYSQMGFTVIPTEYQIKAKYLYNFARFVDWPEESFNNPDSPFVIGIIGSDPYGIDLEKTIEGKQIKNREFRIRRYQNLEDLSSCHILFIGVDNRDRRSQIFSKIKNNSILTVGDETNFSKDGGMINFIIKKKKIRFEINSEAVKQSGLKMSTKLLKMADIPEPSLE
ncbi:YfiR family protein [bacterium]|nr:YfiR family protein [bacterium]